MMCDRFPVLSSRFSVGSIPANEHSESAVLKTGKPITDHSAGATLDSPHEPSEARVRKPRTEN
jgi:hypothetical protein